MGGNLTFSAKAAPGAGGVLTISKPSDLAAVGDLNLLEGSLIFIDCFMAWFALTKKTPLANEVENVTVRARSGAANWIRLPITHPSNLQKDFRVDGVSGDDTSIGTGVGVLALKTWAELSRRIGDLTGLSRAMTIYAATDVPAGDEWIVTGNVALGGSVSIVGTRVVAKTGTLSAATNRNRATNVPNRATDSAGASWAAYFNLFNVALPTCGRGYRMRLTSGANAGATAPLIADLGAGAVQLGDFVQPATSTAYFCDGGKTLAGNETYEVTRPVAGPLILSTINAATFNDDLTTCTISIADVQLQNSPTGSWSTFLGSAEIYMMSCWANGLEITGTDAVFLFDQYAIGDGSSYIMSDMNLIQVLGGVCFRREHSWPFYTSAANVLVGQDFTSYGRNGFFAQNGAEIEVGNFGSWFGSAPAEYMFLAWTGGGVRFNAGSLYGASNAGPMLAVLPGGYASYKSYLFPIVTSGGADFALNAKTTAAVFRADTGAFQAAIACTFANLVAGYGAGFGGSVVDIESGAAFVVRH